MPRQPGVTFSGPFFTKDPKATFRQNARKMLEGMAREAQAEVQQEAAAHSRSGAFRGGVIGRVHALNGKRWALTAVISEQHVYRWPGGGQKQYRGGKLEAKYHMFRRTASALRSSRAQAMADLTAGLN